MLPTPLPRKLPRQSRSKFTVDTILQSAAHILKKNGYVGFNTNLVAEHAGISIGSLYQYFPNKDALVVALHHQHTANICTVVKDVLNITPKPSLNNHIEMLVDAIFEVHQHEPELHTILEREFPFFDVAYEEDNQIRILFYYFIEMHLSEIKYKNINLISWMVLKMVETLVHSAIISPPKSISFNELKKPIILSIYLFLKNYQ